MNSNKRIKRKVRNAYAISTVSIALVLFLLGAVGYLILGALNASDRLKESVSVYVMLDQKAAPDTVAMIGKQLQALDSIKEVRFISKDQAAREFQEYLGTDFVDFLQENPLPDSYELKLDAAASDRQSLARLEKQISAWVGVEEVVYQKNVIDQISTNVNKFNLVLLMFGGALLVISLVLLNNTIRVSIFSKRYVINTMKLVGATHGFIRRPFMSRSFYMGLTAAIVANGLLFGGIQMITRYDPSTTVYFDDMMLLCTGALIIVISLTLTLACTYFSTNKYLKKKASEVY